MKARFGWWTALLSFGLVAGYLAGRAEGIPDGLATGEDERAGLVGYRLTSPFLEAVGRRDADPDLVAARLRIEEFIQAEQRRDPTLKVGVYARDLLNGPWIGVNERQAFRPASLMKVSVLIYTLHRIAHDSELRTREIVYPGPQAMPSSDNMASEPAERRMEPGAAYSIPDLLWRMIGYSDNHAKDLLVQGLAPGEVDRFLAEHGVPVKVEGRDAVMTARSYAVLFRLLYNSSVLSREDSEYALDLLARATFDSGFRAAVPPTVRVASKFGSFFSRDTLEAGVQLHECGIIYLPERPLTACVMTSSQLRGDNLPAIIRGVVGEIVADAA